MKRGRKGGEEGEGAANIPELAINKFCREKPSKRRQKCDYIPIPCISSNIQIYIEKKNNIIIK